MLPGTELETFESESLVLSNAYAIYKLSGVGTSLDVSERQSLYLQNGNDIVYLMMVL